MKEVLIISFSDLKNDPRVFRQIGFFRDRYRLTTIGLNDAQLPSVEFIPIQQQNHAAAARITRALGNKLGQFERYYWGLYHFEQPLARLGERRFDLIIANDLHALPLAVRVARGAKIMLDAHEYFPRQFEDRWRWNFFSRAFINYLCRTYLPHCDRMITVSAGIADEYRKDFNVRAQVITNSCEYHDLQPAAASAPGPIRLIHHGNAIPSRRLEVMIELMKRSAADLTLDLMLMPVVPGYYRKLRKAAADNRRIQFIPPVPMAQIVPFLNRYDVGLCIYKPTSFNLLHSLPNKFFEFIQARLAVFSGPSPEMARIIRQHDLGVVAEDFSLAALQRALAGLNRKGIDHFKNQAHQAARELSSAANRQKLLALARELIGD